MLRTSPDSPEKRNPRGDRSVSPNKRKHRWFRAIAQQDFSLDRYQALDDLKPYTIGKIQDNALAGGIDEADLTFDETATVQSNVRKLVTNRVDLIAGVRWRLRHQIREIGLSWDDFKVLMPPLGSQASYLAVSKKHPKVEWGDLQFQQGNEDDALGRDV